MPTLGLGLVHTVSDLYYRPDILKHLILGILALLGSYCLGSKLHTFLGNCQGRPQIKGRAATDTNITIIKTFIRSI